jgi:hypothetical protein
MGHNLATTIIDVVNSKEVESKSYIITLILLNPHKDKDINTIINTIIHEDIHTAITMCCQRQPESVEDVIDYLTLDIPERFSSLKALANPKKLYDKAYKTLIIWGIECIFTILFIILGASIPMQIIFFMVSTFYWCELHSMLFKWRYYTKRGLLKKDD